MLEGEDIKIWMNSKTYVFLKKHMFFSSTLKIEGFGGRRYIYICAHPITNPIPTLPSPWRIGTELAKSSLSMGTAPNSFSITANLGRKFHGAPRLRGSVKSGDGKLRPGEMARFMVYIYIEYYNIYNIYIYNIYIYRIYIYRTSECGYMEPMVNNDLCLRMVNNG